MTVKPEPPPQVEVGRDGLGEAAALEDMDHIASLGARWVALGVVPGQQGGGTTPHVADPDVIIAVHIDAPREADRRAGEALRRWLCAIRTDHVDLTGDACRWPHDVLERGISEDLELLHDGRVSGELRDRHFQVHVVGHPDVFLRVQRQGAHTAARH